LRLECYDFFLSFRLVSHFQTNNQKKKVLDVIQSEQQFKEAFKGAVED